MRDPLKTYAGFPCGMAMSEPVSNSIRELINWKLIRRVPVLGDRRHHYEAGADLWQIPTRIAQGRLSMMRSQQSSANPETARPNRGPPTRPTVFSPPNRNRRPRQVEHSCRHLLGQAQPGNNVRASPVAATVCHAVSARIKSVSTIRAMDRTAYLCHVRGAELPISKKDQAHAYDHHQGRH
jgi:hypothetical protein